MNILEMRNELLSNGKTIYDLSLNVTDYSRVSTDSKSQETSMANQTYYYKNLILNTPNWTYIDGYADDGITGTSTAHRDDFNRMVEDGLNGKFDLILTKEVSRFARNTLDSIFYTRELLKSGVAVFFENDNINTLYPDSEFKLTIIASLAQEESRKTSQRVKWARRRAIEQGQIYIPPNMHGYRMVDGKVEIVEEEAKLVQRIFELYCQGYGFRLLGEKLKEEGYLNSNGNPYNISSLRSIITNPRYKGYFTGGMYETVDHISKKVIERDPEDWIMYPAPDIVPPIVSEEVWNNANELLQKKRKKVYLTKETSYQNKYKYSGKIYCKKHGTAFHRTLYRYKKAPDREVYQCKVYRQEGKKGCDTPMLYTDELDAIMACIFKTIFKHKDDFINELLTMIEKHLQEDDFTKDITKAMSEIEKIKTRKDKLLDLTLNDLISKSEFKKRNEEFNHQLELLDEELKKYESLRKAKRNSKDQLKLMEKFLNEKYDLDKEVPDKLIDAFVDKIWVETGEVENLVKLEINLKTGQKVPVYYRKDILLSLATHLIRADITTEVSPLIGTEKQSEELVKYFLDEFEGDPSRIWKSNLFGKSLNDLVNEQLQGKLNMMPEDARAKMRRTLERIINDGSGALICIII